MKKVKVLFVLLIAVSFIVGVVPFAFAEQDGKININTAPLEELVKLKRIGPAYAKKIIAYRETNGPFEKPEDIIKVKGIGRKTYEANKDRIITE
ncbi:MAG: helix-hairpin-helix domain-containing protein [Deltaproteobacteria bacterium]|uniref:Helix-hairpin-helix domain-containing protein n=1 Tax=Candidatus Desulfacyla euxinica TaxID=2841693 RepID=A0A8J6MXQ1_9DELT|nr:helix-hairpin-helix domain-containing protein [Candidatus Desulfacyla euxinica]